MTHSSGAQEQNPNGTSNISNDKSEVDFYRSVEPQLIACDDVEFALRVFGKVSGKVSGKENGKVSGQGPSLVFIHGYPVHGFTWRKLLPSLSQHFTCYVVDLPGFGDSRWTRRTDFTFTAQIRRLQTLLSKHVPSPYTLIAHDTGATLARMVAHAQPENVNQLIMFNTEMPNHRPPWIKFYQKLAKLPGALLGFRLCMSSQLFLQSPMGLREFYSDKQRFNDRNWLAPYIDPLTSSQEKMFGAIAYLQGIEWHIVDGLLAVHPHLKADTLFLWGEDDKTFPISLGKKMAQQLGGKTTFVTIKNASLMPHEEQPQEVITEILKFVNQPAQNNSDFSKSSALG